jgi:hypothetical protein
MALEKDTLRASHVQDLVPSHVLSRKGIDAVLSITDVEINFGIVGHPSDWDVSD